MDLNKYLKEPAQLKPDFGWWIDAETFDVEGNHRNPHECKDELALQWGNEGYTLDTEDKIVPNKVANRKDIIQSTVIQSVRTMMNSGMKTASIREYLAKQNNQKLVQACSQEIDRQLKLEGSVGRFVLDARGYRSCADALKTAEKNPYRKHMHYVIGCTCGNHVKTRKITSCMMVSDGDPIGDSLKNDTQNTDETINSCPKSGMQILSGQGDIDSQWAGNTMIDVMNACELDKDGGKKFTASSEQPYMRLKKFFIALDNGEFDKMKEDSLDMNSEEGINMNSAAILVKTENFDTPAVDINDQSGKVIQLNPEIKKESPLGDVTMDKVVSIPELENDAEVLPVDIPTPETNTFALNHIPEKKDILINNDQSPIEMDLTPVDLISNIEFGTPEEDELFSDGKIDLDEKAPEAGMIFAF